MQLVGRLGSLDCASEDFLFANLAQSLALQSHSGNQGFLRFSLHSLSFDAFATHASRQKPSLGARGKVAAGNITVVLSPSAPNLVATVHHGVLTAPEQVALWRTVLNSSQKQHNLSRKQTHIFKCGFQQFFDNYGYS